MMVYGCQLFHWIKYFCLNRFTVIKNQVKLEKLFFLIAPRQKTHLACDFIMYIIMYITLNKAKHHYMYQPITLWGWSDHGTSCMDHWDTSSSSSKMKLSFYPKVCSVFCYRRRSPSGAFVWQDFSSTVSSYIQPITPRNKTGMHLFWCKEIRPMLLAGDSKTNSPCVWSRVHSATSWTSLWQIWHSSSSPSSGCSMSDFGLAEELNWEQELTPCNSKW